MPFIELNGLAINLDHVATLRRHWSEDRNKRTVIVKFADGTRDRFDGELAARRCGGRSRFANLEGY
jgi:hypothetical protein